MTKPYPFQKQGIKKLHAYKGRALLADEMGLGKTFQMLGYAHKYVKKRKLLLATVPAYLKHTWEQEALEHFGMASLVLEGTRADRSVLHKPPRLIIINYEIFHHWAPLLKKLDFGIGFLDECEYLMNPASLRTRSIGPFYQKLPKAIAASGTPLTKRPLDLWANLHILRPKVWNDYEEYVKEYCDPKLKSFGGRRTWDLTGASNVGKLHKKLKHPKKGVLIRRLKKDVLKELPQKRNHIVPLTVKGMKEYRTAEKDFIAWLTKKSKKKAMRAIRATGINKPGYLRRLIAELKIKSIIKWIEKWLEENPNEKIVLFGIHKKFIYKIAEHFEKECVVVTGKVPAKKRKDLERRFKEDTNIRIFLGNIKAAGRGITLTNSSAVAILELPWVPADLQQAIDRIHRIGQKNTCDIFFLLAAKTIEEKLCRILQEGWKVVSGVLDGRDTSDLNIYEQLRMELKNDTNPNKKSSRRNS